MGERAMSTFWESVKPRGSPDWSVEENLKDIVDIFLIRFYETFQRDDDIFTLNFILVIYCDLNSFSAPKHC